MDRPTDPQRYAPYILTSPTGAFGLEVEAYIPPTRVEHFEGGDPVDGDVLGPWGVTYFPTWAEAVEWMHGNAALIEQANADLATGHDVRPYSPFHRARVEAFVMRTASRADLSMPWPVRLEVDGRVTEGRPDARLLIGWQRSLEVQHVDLLARDVLGMGRDGLEAVVGMFPVYFGDLGGPGVNGGTGMFATGDAVTSLEAVGA